MDTRLGERVEAQIYLKHKKMLSALRVSDPLQMSHEMKKLHKCQRAFSTLTELKAAASVVHTSNGLMLF